MPPDHGAEIAPGARPGQPNVRLDIRHVAVAGRDDHPSAANGVHNVARLLMREQRATGHDASLFLLTQEEAAQGEGMLGEEPGVQRVPMEGVSIRSRPVLLRRSVAERLLADAGEQTVFHIHGGREPLLVGLANRIRRRGLPYAVTTHGRFSHVYDRAGACLKRSTALYLGLVERGMLSRARFIQALSQAEARVLRRVAPGSTVAVVGNGAFSSRLGPALAPPGGRAPSAGFPLFVFCGRYAIHHKGLDLLLRGFALYRQAGGTGRLLTIGSGPARVTLQAMAAGLGISDAATIGEARFSAERDALVRGCDYFVMASRYEGVPLAALEAAAAGLPLIVTDETGLGDAIRSHGAGFPIEALSAEAVGAALGHASRQSETAWAAQRASAHRMVQEIGDWTAISARLCELYGSSAPARPSPTYTSTPRVTPE